MSTDNTKLEKMTWDGTSIDAEKIQSWASSKHWQTYYFLGAGSIQPRIKLYRRYMEVMVYPGDTLVYDGRYFYFD